MELSRERIRGIKPSAFRTSNIVLVKYIVRAIAVIISITYLGFYYLNMSSEVWDFSANYLFFVYIFNIFIILISFIIAAIFVVTSLVAVGQGGDFIQSYFVPAYMYTYYFLFGRKYTGSVSENSFIYDPFGWLGSNALQFLDVMINVFILLIFIFVAFTSIGFIMRSNVNYALISFFLYQFGFTLALLNGKTISLYLDLTDIFTMVGSNLFQLALVSYLYVEFALQTNYIYSIIDPNVERRRSTRAMLQRLQEFTPKTQQKKTKEKGAEAIAGNTVLFRKYGYAAMTFLMDAIEKRKYRPEELTMQHVTSRLKSFYTRVKEANPLLEERLAATSIKLNPLTIILYALFSITVRFVVMIFLVWVLMNPYFVLKVLNAPTSLTNSLEIYPDPRLTLEQGKLQPEAVLTVLVPFIFIMFLMGEGLAYVQRKLFGRVSEKVIIAQSKKIATPSS